MARLAELQSLIQEMGAGLSRLDHAIAADPNSTSLVLAAKSFRNQYDQLQEQFLAEANRLEVDVCTYRMFAVMGSARLTLNEITKTLHDFQELFTTVFRALRSRTIKRRSQIKDPDFGFAYSFPGSLGVTLTLPRELQLFGSEQDFVDTIQTVFGMASARTADEILQYARNIGRAAVQQMDTWAADHTDHGLGADIGWKIQTPAPKRLFIQPPEIGSLRRAISLSAYSEPKNIEIVGELHGADTDRKSFHFKTETGQDIYGRFSDAITPEHRAQLPAPYMAKVRVTTQTLYATEREADDYFLLSLEPRDAYEVKKR